MKPKIESVNNVTKTWDYGNYKLIEKFVDDKLVNQYFVSKRPKKSHPYSYDSKSMRFYYYEGISYFVGMQTSYERGGHPEPTIITDPENFKDFDKCVCFWLGMDGWVWVLNSEYPLPCKKAFDYVGGFTNDHFDLNVIQKIISKKPWVTLCEIEDIPYYNQEEGRTLGLKIEVDLTKKLIKKIFDNSKLKSKDEEFQMWGIFKNGMDIYGIKEYYKGE